ncbi:UNVERIFIED_CONTAM: hypothetical protein FKN15_065032 [Acipenser sinensis]
MTPQIGAKLGSVIKGMLGTRSCPVGAERATVCKHSNANYLGSLLQSSTVCLGTGPQGDVYVPFGRLLPMVHPNDIVFDGWDISSMDLAAAMERAQVLDWSLQEQLRPHMEKLKPRPSIYFPKFIAANQEERADNVIQGTQQEQTENRTTPLNVLTNLVFVS